MLPAPHRGAEVALSLQLPPATPPLSSTTPGPGSWGHGCPQDQPAKLQQWETQREGDSRVSCRCLQRLLPPEKTWCRVWNQPCSFCSLGKPPDRTPVTQRWMSRHGMNRQRLCWDPSGHSWMSSRCLVSSSAEGYLRYKLQ